MPKHLLRLGRVSTLFALLLCLLPRAAPAAPCTCTPPLADWTVLLLLNADNFGNDDAWLMEELAGVQWTESVRLVAMVDQYADSAQPILGEPAQCGGMVYLSEAGLLRSKACLVGDPTPSGGPRDPNLGSPSYVELLLRLGRQWAPAKNVCLWIEGHGEGWVGVCHDASHEGTADNVLSFPELAQVLAQAPAPPGEPSVDLLVLDTCTSACAEMLTRIGPHVPWIVATEGFVDIEGLQQNTVLGELVAQPAMTPEQLGRRLVQTYQDPTATVCDGNRDYGVMSLLRTADCNTWKERAKDLLDIATGMWSVAPATYELDVRDACALSQGISCEQMPLACHLIGDEVGCCMHDVRDAAELISGIADPTLAQAAVDMSNACGQIVRCRSAGADADLLNGFSFFYPCHLPDINPYQVEPMAQATGWGPFLLRQAGDGCAEEPAQYVGPVSVSQESGAWRVTAPLALAPEAVEAAYLMICLPESRQPVYVQAISVGPLTKESGFSVQWDGRVLCAGDAEGGIPLAHAAPVSGRSSPKVVTTSELLWRREQTGAERSVRAGIVYTSEVAGLEGRVLNLQSTGREGLGVFLWPWRVGDRLRLDPASELAQWWRAASGVSKDTDISTPVTSVPLPCAARYLHSAVPAVAALRIKPKGKAAHTFYAPEALPTPWR